MSFFRRHIQAALAGGRSRNKIRLLFGARQTGKTELLRRLLAGSGAHFFNLQAASDRRRFESDPASFSRVIRGLPAATKVIVVDEIQKVPALLDEIQGLYDDAPHRWQFYLTGSSARRLRTSSANLLPGRAHTYDLYPVCNWEVEPSAELAIPASRVSRPDGVSGFPPQDLRRTLLFGNLPGARSEADETAQATLEAYVDLYLEEEIRREALVRDLGPFHTFIRLAATESGKQVNIARLSQESGIPASTLKNYYQVLVDTFVGHWLPAYSRRARKRLLTTPRFYIFDVGVRNAAAGIALNRPLESEAGGPLLEQWVGLDLLARAGYLGRTHQVSFWRTSYGVEVDFVWETPQEDIPIEVKWTARPRPEDAAHLERFLDEYPRRARRGLLVCRCKEVEQLTHRVRAIPWNHV